MNSESVNRQEPAGRLDRVVRCKQCQYSDVELDAIHERMKHASLRDLTCEDLEEWAALFVARPDAIDTCPSLRVTEEHIISLVQAAQTAGAALADLYPDAPSRREGRSQDRGFSLSALPGVPARLLCDVSALRSVLE